MKTLSTLNVVQGGESPEEMTAIGDVDVVDGDLDVEGEDESVVEFVFKGEVAPELH